MKEKLFITAIVVTLIMTILVSSCEERVEIDGRDFVPTLTVNALMNPDTIIFVNVSKTETLFSDNSDSVKDYPIDLLSVTVSINNGDYFSLSYDQKSGNYISEVIPKIGDVIKLNIIDTRGNYKSVTSETKVMKKPEFSIVRYYKQYSKKPGNLIKPERFQDSVACIVCKIKDPSNEKNHYRMSLHYDPTHYISTSFRPDFTPGFMSVQVFDNFTSDDMIFSDSAITASLGGFPIGFSEIFNDSTFDGKEYEFMVKIRVQTHGGEPVTADKDPKYIIITKYLIHITLNQLSEQTYRYLKSLKYSLCAEDDIFSEPAYLYTNINNGTGIFGSNTNNTKTISVLSYTWGIFL